MNHLNIRRELLSRLALANMAKRSGLPLRVSHANVLFLVYELSRKHAIGVSGYELLSMLTRLKRGSDFGFLQRTLADLRKHGLIEQYRSGRSKRYHPTAAGRVFLSDFEKTLRITRTDRRLLNLKKIKPNATRRKVYSKK